jgi:transcriptional regulator with XRE-family HTH domain
MAFAENLRRRRLEQFLSQAELARRAGLHALTITRLEAGATAPSTRTVRALAEALGLEPRDLATPREVAELRRVLGEPSPPEGGGRNRRDGRNDEQAAAQPDASSPADEA